MRSWWRSPPRAWPTRSSRPAPGAAAAPSCSAPASTRWPRARGASPRAGRGGRPSPAAGVRAQLQRDRLAAGAGVAVGRRARRRPSPGAVALVSQSGNVAVNALATRRGLRFHTVVASGNQAVLSAADFLEFLAGEDDLGAVALYLEDDGGPRLCDGLAACADAGVPVVVLKVGRTAAGARAAAAHSGALAGDQRVFRSLVHEAGAVWAEDVHDLLELAKTLAVPTGATRRSRARRAGPSRDRDHDLLGRRLRPGRRRGRAARARAAGARPRRPRRGWPSCCPSAATVANPLDYTAMIWGDRAGAGGAGADARRGSGGRPGAGLLRPAARADRRPRGVLARGARGRDRPARR